jgi:hypothetical protein
MVFGMPSNKRKRRLLYSKGELNKLIDDLVHPHYKQNEGLRLLDAVLHGLVEQNPSESFHKFVRYNLPDIMKKILRKRNTRDAK